MVKYWRIILAKCLPRSVGLVEDKGVAAHLESSDEAQEGEGREFHRTEE